MPMLARTIATPVAVDVRRGAVAGLAGLLSDGRISSGGDVAVAVGGGLGERLAAVLAEALPAATVLPVGEATVEEGQRLVGRLREGTFDALVGIGGGQTLDVAKYAASFAGLPFVAVATNLSHDGLASPVSSLSSGGRKASFGVHVPLGVFVDLDLVREAHPRQIRSGIGDVVSNLSAIADWELAARVTGDDVDGLAVLLARNAAESLLGCEQPLTSDTFLVTLAEGLIASGLAMIVAGSSRPCSGACHEISHALDLFHGAPAGHGEQVAVGALFASWLRDDPRLPEVDACLRRYDVPRLPRDLGIDVDTFADAVVRAPETRPGRFTVLEHLDLDADETREKVHAFVAALDH
jgi:glycerol-1-phosphate dehydrogenase [NAD(P)+]